MPVRALTVLYGAAHFWVDLSCALLLFRILPGRPEFALCLLLYNFCAFALQMPLGVLADRLNRNGAVAAVGCALTAAAYAGLPPLPAALTAGIGNALFHLGGGIELLNESRDSAAALGVFISPGALGLWLGTRWGRGSDFPLWPAPLALTALAYAILWASRKRSAAPCSDNEPVDFSGQPAPLRPTSRRSPATPRSDKAPVSFSGQPAPLRPTSRRRSAALRSDNAPFDLAGQAAPLLPLFLAVVLRSYLGMNQRFPWAEAGAFALPLALALGKAAGGFLSDRLGPRRAAAVSLGAAAALYLFSGFPPAGALAVFAFQMTMPITLWAAARCLPGAKGFAFGLLTFALFLGFLPGWMGWPPLSGPWSCAAVSLLSLALLWKPLRNREEPRC